MTLTSATPRTVFRFSFWTLCWLLVVCLGLAHLPACHLAKPRTPGFPQMLIVDKAFSLFELPLYRAISRVWQREPLFLSRRAVKVVGASHAHLSGEGWGDRSSCNKQNGRGWGGYGRKSSWNMHTTDSNQCLYNGYRVSRCCMILILRPQLACWGGKTSRFQRLLYSHIYSKSMDQPGKVANPARGQLNRENEYFPVRVRAGEIGLARRVRQSHPASARSSPYSGWIWCLLTRFLPSSAAASIYLFKTAIRHWVSPEFIGPPSCVPMAFAAESPSAQGQ